MERTYEITLTSEERYQIIVTLSEKLLELEKHRADTNWMNLKDAIEEQESTLSDAIYHIQRAFVK